MIPAHKLRENQQQGWGNGCGEMAVGRMLTQSDLRHVISACSFTMSKPWDEGLTVDMLGGNVGMLEMASSIILSAVLASSETEGVLLAEARTMQTLDRSCCKKS